MKKNNEWEITLNVTETTQDFFTTLENGKYLFTTQIPYESLWLHLKKVPFSCKKKKKKTLIY